MNEAHANIVISWDSEAEVYYVKKSDISGLHIEASSIEEMSNLLDEYVPYLIEENKIRIHISASVDGPQRESKLIGSSIAEITVGHVGTE